MHGRGSVAFRYRDVQLSLLVTSEEAKARGVDCHICELQLHLPALLALKSAGGHEAYVRCRNMRGE